MTREQLEQVGNQLIEEGRIDDYLIEEAQNGELRLLVRDPEATDYAPFPLRPAD